MDFDKILDDSNRGLGLVRERHRKESRKATIISVLCLLPFIFMTASIFIQAAKLDDRADACVNAGGVFARVYDGYECFSKDSLKTVEVK